MNKEQIIKNRLVYNLSFLVLQDVNNTNNDLTLTALDKKIKIRALINIVDSCKNYTNQEINTLLNEFYPLPF